MPYADLLKRREYLREYMRKHKQVLTPEQKARKLFTNKEWTIKNADKLAAYQSERWLRDKEMIQERKKERDIKYPEIRQLQSKTYYKKPEVKLRIYKRGADARGLEFTLTLEEFKKFVQDKCHYCGSENSIGIDRKDNAIGYTSKNSLSCCKICNFMKGTLKYQDFIRHIRIISERFNH